MPKGSELLQNSEVRQVHDLLRAAILRGEIPPRHPLSQLQLAKDYGISRTPLREALRMLEREGLVVSEPHRRARVAGFSAGDVEQIYAVRITLEALALRLTVPMLGDDDMAALEREIETMARYAEARAFEPWEVHHQSFHGQLIQHAGDRMVAQLTDLADHSARYRRVYLAEPHSWESAAAEHAAILEACRARDLAEASSLLAAHLARTALTLIAIADPTRDPLPVRTALRMVTGDPELDGRARRGAPDRKRATAT